VYRVQTCRHWLACRCPWLCYPKRLEPSTTMLER
jgi:hypothetical protein